MLPPALGAVVVRLLTGVIVIGNVVTFPSGDVVVWLLPEIGACVPGETVPVPLGASVPLRMVGASVQAGASVTFPPGANETLELKVTLVWGGLVMAGLMVAPGLLAPSMDVRLALLPVSGGRVSNGVKVAPPVAGSKPLPGLLLLLDGTGGVVGGKVKFLGGTVVILIPPSPVGEAVVIIDVVGESVSVNVEAATEGAKVDRAVEASVGDSIGASVSSQSPSSLLFADLDLLLLLDLLWQDPLAPLLLLLLLLLLALLLLSNCRRLCGV